MSIAGGSSVTRVRGASRFVSESVQIICSVGPSEWKRLTCKSRGWYTECLRSRNLGGSTSVDHSRQLSKPIDRSILFRAGAWESIGQRNHPSFVVPRGRSSIHGIGITSSLIGWHRFREQITESASSICTRVRKLIDARPCPIV